MRDRLILLPGWALGTGPLEPLAAALQGLDERLRVDVEALPDEGDLSDWLDALAERLPEDTWLGGWSLGGMLAAELAARRGERCCGLLTLASNVCFVARADWPVAMPQATFEAFRQGCSRDAAQTLKRFALLCSQGGNDARAMAWQLVLDMPKHSAEQMLAGLRALAELDTRSALQAFGGPQLHLYAAGDALVPASTAGALGELLPDVEIGVLQGAGHAFVLERPHEVAASIHAFLHEVGDD